MRHRAYVLLVVVLGGVLLALSPQAASGAVGSERCSKLLASLSSQPTPDPSTLPEECRQQYEQQQKSSNAPTPTPSATAPQASAPVKPQAAEPTEPKVFKDFQPSTSAEEWAMESGRSADDLLGELNRALGDSPKTLGTGFATPYAVAWGIGLVLMAFVITVTSAQAAGGAERRAQLESAGWRAWTYYPAMLIVPTIAYQLYATAGHMAGWFGDQGAPARSLVFRMFAQRLGEVAAPAMLLGGGTLTALFILGLIVVFAFLALLEVALAQYGLFLLLCFVPPMAALAIHPRFRPGLARLTGAIVGALLVPPVLQFGFWVSMSIAADTLTAERLGKEGTLRAFALVLVCLVVASMVPLLMALLMPRVVSAVAADESVRRGLGNLGSRAQMEGRMAADRLARTGGRGARPRMSSPAGGAAGASAAQNASAGAATKAAAAASGPAAPVTAAVGASLQAGLGALRSAYRGTKSKLGGGGGRGRNGGGGAGGTGRVPSSPAQGSGAPPRSGGTTGGSRPAATSGGNRPDSGGAPQGARSTAEGRAGVGAAARGPSFRPPRDGAR